VSIPVGPGPGLGRPAVESHRVVNRLGCREPSLLRRVSHATLVCAIVALPRLLADDFDEPFRDLHEGRAHVPNHM